MSREIDFGKTAGDYSRHRAGFPDELFERLAARGIGTRGQDLLDMGTGTGSLARGFAQRGCLVTGLDPSIELINQAQALDAQAGVSVRYVTGKAEDIKLPKNIFDVVTAGQSWHWFNRPRAAAEVKRVLHNNGWLVIAHFDWLPLAGNVVEATERLILQHNPAWQMAGGTGLYPQWLRDVREAGFRQVETFSFDIPVAYTPESWRGRIRASAGVGATLMPDDVQRFDAEHAKLLSDRFPGNRLDIPHRVWALVCRRPPRVT